MDFSILKDTSVQVVFLITLLIVSAVIIVTVVKGYSIEFWPPKLTAPSDLRRANRPESLFFIERQDVDKTIGTIEKRFKAARHEILISGNDNKYIMESCSALIDDALSRGVRIKILCTDPESPAAEMLAIIDPRYKSAFDFKVSMASVIWEMEKRRLAYPTLFECRLLQFLPAISFFIVDPLLPSGIVKFEIYTAKPYESRPHFILPVDNKWRSFFINQWNNYWGLARKIG